MSKLKAIKPNTVKAKKPKIIVFGKAGVGKTWVSLDFPNVYYIDTEGGATNKEYTDKLTASGGMYLGAEQGAGSFAEILEQIKALATEKHSYKTLVIDSITKIFNDEIALELEKMAAAKKDLSATYGAEKKPAISYMRQLVRWIGKLDMNVILICHEVPEWGKDEKGNRVEIDSTYDGWIKLEYELDLCLRIIKRAEKRSARVRKTRLTGFPDASVFDWSYPEFSARYGKDVMESEVELLELATPEQLSELKALMEVVKIPEGQEEKWFKAFDAESYGEMKSEHVAKIITVLKGKII